jgi:peptide/nickel transport system substrate-binding protein/oligopeptide transport system substrate-binding protein
MYQQNELDFSDLVPDYAFGELFITHSPDLHIFGLLGTYYASFNTKSDLFADKTTAQAACLREAISMLIDREAICIRMGGGSSLQPAGTFIPAGMSGGNGKLFFENNYFDPYAMARDPEQTLQYARTLLIAAGYRFGPDGKLSAETPIEIEYLTNPGGNVTIAEMIRDNLAVLGVRLTITELGWNDFREAVDKGEFDIARSGWIADFNDPVNMLELWTSDSGNNNCFFGQ